MKKGGVVTTPPFFMRRLIEGRPVIPQEDGAVSGQNSKWTEPITVRGAPNV